MVKKFVVIGGGISFIGIILIFLFGINFLAIGNISGLPGGIKDMEVQGDFVYICDESLTIIDATNPAHPYIFKIIEMLNPQWISYQNGYLFLQEGDGNVQIVDVKDTYNPTVIDVLSQAGVLALRGDLLYSVRSPNTIKSGIFSVYNFSKPNDPVILSERSSVVDWAKDFKIQGDYGYIIGGEALLTVVNISNPLNINIISTFYDEGISRHAGQKLQIYNNIAFITDFFTDYEDSYKLNLYAINISDPTLPKVLWKLDSKDIENIWVEPDMLYCTSSKEGLLVYNISSLENPVLIHTYNPFFSFISAAEVHNDYIYILGFITGLNRLQILDKNSLGTL
jgi:hypothetical protein